MEGLTRYVQVEAELVPYLPAFCDAFSYPGLLKVEMKWFDRNDQLGVGITLDNGRRQAVAFRDQRRTQFDPTEIMRRVVEEIEQMLGISSPCPKCGEPFSELQVNMEACKVTYAPCGCVSAWDEGAKHAANA